MKYAGLFSVFICLLLISCGKEHSGIPDVVVNFRKPINDPALFPLNTPGNAVEISGYGVSGLIIYRSAFSGYRAYDRCSTVNPEKRCAVEIDDTRTIAADPCSGAVFSLEDGSPARSPAKRSLKQYSVSIANGYLTVVN